MMQAAHSSSGIEVTSLPQLTPLGAWQIELCHDRAQDLIIWITRGQGRVLLGGKRRGFGPHNLLFIPAGSLWSLELGRNAIGSCLFLPTSNAPSAGRPPFFLRLNDSQTQAHITFLLERIQQEQRNRQDRWTEAMSAFVTLLIIEMERTAATQDNQDAPLSAAQKLIQSYCDRVTRLYCEGLSMSDHAAALGVTPTHLTRVCKAETGKSAATLLMERQLHSARSHLIYSDTPIQDIAARLGFGSPAYFSRFVTQHTGMTPSKLRKSARAVPIS